MVLQQGQGNRRWLTGGGREKCILIVSNIEKAANLTKCFLSHVFSFYYSLSAKMFIVGSPAGTLFKILEKR